MKKGADLMNFRLSGKSNRKTCFPNISLNSFLNAFFDIWVIDLLLLVGRLFLSLHNLHNSSLILDSYPKRYDPVHYVTN